MKTEKLHGPSADILIYRYDEHGEIEILTGVRQHEPWKGCTTVPFGGHAEPSDENIVETALRETEEETGIVVQIDFCVGIYGPRRYQYGLVRNTAEMIAHRDGPLIDAIIVDNNSSSINHVFAGRILHGTLKESLEQKNLKFVRPIELAHKQLCSDHALVLVDFLRAIRDGSAQTWRREALALVK